MFVIYMVENETLTGLTSAKAYFLRVLISENECSPGEYKSKSFPNCSGKSSYLHIYVRTLALLSTVHVAPLSFAPAAGLLSL